MLRVSVVKRRPEFTLRASFEAPTPGVIALFGRSGSGKTTLVDIIAGLLPPDEGEVQLAGSVLTDTRRGIAVAVERRRIGYVFQDARLFPHLTVLGNLRYGEKRAAGEPHYIGLEEVTGLLGLGALLERRPHQLSGGERQRVGIARAIVGEPAFILADEIVSGLDVSTQAQILTLLRSLRDEMGLALALIAHDLSVVRVLCDRVVVMLQGRIVEEGSCEQVFAAPRHDYTRRLIAAIPLPEIDDAWLDRSETEVAS
jgi:molybdate transport system ATP-binding protein